MSGAVLLLLLLLLPACSEATAMSFMDSAGPAASPAIQLGWGLALIALSVVLATVIVVSWATIRHRSPNEASEAGIANPGRSGLSWIYTGVPITVVILVGVFFWTMRVLAEVQTPDVETPIVVEVSGHQWWWEVRYSDGDPSHAFVTANEIHLPVGQPVRVRLDSDDVIHSFWVPRLAGKTDVIPGQFNTMWIEASEPGTYRGQCTEYCGLEHARMAMSVIAESPDAFAEWWSSQLAAAESPPEVDSPGELVFVRSCGACHAVRGTDALGRVGPDLTHLMSRERIASGMLANTGENLEQWILHSQQLKPGARMPSISLPEEELRPLLAYLQTLD